MNTEKLSAYNGLKYTPGLFCYAESEKSNRRKPSKQPGRNRSHSGCFGYRVWCYYNVKSAELQKFHKTIPLPHMVVGKEGVQMLPKIEELQEMQSADIRQIDRDRLADISQIEIDRNQSTECRVRSYLEQTRNPFFVRSGEYVLQFQYSDKDRDINHCMMEYLSNMAKIHIHGQ